MKTFKPISLILLILLTACSSDPTGDQAPAPSGAEKDEMSEIPDPLIFSPVAVPDEGDDTCVDECEPPGPLVVDMCYMFNRLSKTIALVEMLEDEGEFLGSGDCDSIDKYASARYHTYRVKVHAVAAGRELGGQELQVVDFRMRNGIIGLGRGVELSKGDLLMMGLRQARGEWFNVSTLLVSGDGELGSAPVHLPDRVEIRLPASFPEFAEQAEQVLNNFSAECPHLQAQFRDDANFEEYVFVRSEPKCG